MTADQLKDDLDYVTRAVRYHDQPAGVPAIYFLWAVIVGIGFSLPDFAPHAAGVYWPVAGIGGGLLSWWLGARDGRRSGINDAELGKRYGYHWLIAGVGFVLSVLPVAAGHINIADGAAYFLLVAGLAYAYAGLHLNRPILWSGLMMLAAYAVMVLFAPPYAWTLTGIAIALALAWAGIVAQRQRSAGALQ